MHLLALAPFLTAAVVDALAVGHDHAGTHHHHQRRSGFSLNQVAVPGSQRHPLQDYAHAVFRHASKANSGVQTSDKEALGIGSIDNPIFDLLSGLQDLIDGNPAQDDQGEADEGQVTTISATAAGDGSTGQPTPASFSQAARPTNATQPGPSSTPASKASASTKPSQPSQAHKEESDVTANPEQNDILYVIEAQVGDSKLTLNLDTGSADLYVATATQYYFYFSPNKPVRAAGPMAPRPPRTRVRATKPTSPLPTASPFRARRGRSCTRTKATRAAPSTPTKSASVV